MLEYIPISNNLANVVSSYASRNNGIMLADDSSGGNSCSSCEGSCSGTCSGGCSGTCSGSCSGGCYGGCKGGCSGKCTGSCQTSCENACSNSCQTRCENGGQTIATNANTFPFYWFSSIDEGLTIKITAVEWNEFASNVENNAPYCGKTCSVVRVVQNDPIYASDFNSLKNAINKLNNTGINDKIAKESIIEAADFLTLNSKMNSATIINESCCELGQYCVQHCNQSSGTQVGH